MGPAASPNPLVPRSDHCADEIRKPGKILIAGGAAVARALPRKVRKDTASFYTADWAADLLCEMCTRGDERTIVDPACGAGILLLNATKAIIRRRSGAPRAKLRVHGCDINPKAIRVARQSLAPDVQNSTGAATPPFPIEIEFRQTDAFEWALNISPNSFDLVIMNPPFTSHLRMDKTQKNLLREWSTNHNFGEYVSARMGLHYYFLFLAETLVRSGGALALVIPASTFLGDAGRNLRRFWQDKRYCLEIVAEIVTPRGAFSTDCCWKEYLVIARKSSDEDSISPVTRLVRLECEVDAGNLHEVAAQIASGQTSLRTGSRAYGSVKEVPSHTLLFGDIAREFKFFHQGRGIFAGALQSRSLRSLGESPELGTFRGFDATYSRYLILPNEYLSNPRRSLTQENILFDISPHLTKSGKESKLEIPLEYLRPCLRDPRSHDCMVDDKTKYWLLLIPPKAITSRVAAAVTLKRYYLDPLLPLIEKDMGQKSRGGGKELTKSRKDWYLHPWQYFAPAKGKEGMKPKDLSGRVWTFNRYGLWRRQSVATLVHAPVTANHGCYSYFSRAGDFASQSKDYWTLLAAWFNSSLYLLSLFAQAKVPAKHVLQVNLLEHRRMLVPTLSGVHGNVSARREVVDAFFALGGWLTIHPDETIPHQLLACAADLTHPRALLDAAWIKLLGAKLTSTLDEVKAGYRDLAEILLRY